MNRRRCVHPHKDRGSGFLKNVSVRPVPPGQLVLLSDSGWVPVCGFDCLRAQLAAGVLGRRYKDAGIASEFALWASEYGRVADGSLLPHFAEERFAVAQLVLSASLAEAEERYCVADLLRARIADYVASKI